MRSSGVLMHISSLPSPHGIGTLGQQAYAFVDFLKNAGQSCWQVLPLSPTGYGDSPYQSFSSFAGNPYFIDFDLLSGSGLLEQGEYNGLYWGEDPAAVDYGTLFENRPRVLELAARRLLNSGDGDFYDFCRDNSYWLDDYALFMALKDERGGAPWSSWETELRLRQPETMETAKNRLSERLDYYRAVQFMFFRQWQALKDYANSLGISIIGDIPIYAAPDSADVWASPRYFDLDSQLSPIMVAGCPPDGFTEDGQLWGNPVYNWQTLREDGYHWWIERIAHQFRLYDVLRIDHFRGFDQFYCIPCGSENARNGIWRQGPGMELFRAVNAALGQRRFIAEDLGFLTDSVRRMVEESGYPGMKVLQFAFDSREDSDYLPHNYNKNSVAYTGTHDNDTVNGWFSSAPPADTEKAREYLRISPDESKPFAMLSGLWGSVSELAIAQMQDLLELSGDSRMNTPGTLSGNWRWRMTAPAGEGLAEKLRAMTALYGRLGAY